MKSIIFTIIVILNSNVIGQTLLTGTVKDADTEAPLAFCSVIIKDSGKGTITNAEGAFQIAAKRGSDILVFSYIGYESKEIKAQELERKPVVYLKLKDYQLEELTIYSGTDYLYDIVRKCRKRIQRNRKQNTSKVYYGLEAQTGKHPLELLECYYNGQITGLAIDELLFKNGRVGLAPVDNYFVSLHTSKAITKFNLTGKNDYFPPVPTQFDKTRMKRIFNLERISTDSKEIHIGFTSSEKIPNGFSGELWIENGSYALKKINLTVYNPDTHPFLPLFKCDSIYDISIRISNTYKQINGITVPDHFIFDYSFKYFSRRDSAAGVGAKKVLTREVSTHCILYFYDYNAPFIIPYFEYNHNVDDYRKMSIIPYNEFFWNNNSGMLLTEDQKQKLGFLAEDGQLINYREGNYGTDFVILPQFGINDKSVSLRHASYNYYFWSSEKRIRLSRTSELGKEYPPERIRNSFESDLYNLEVQILLDINQVGDRVHWKSYTVFDSYQTFYHLPHDSLTDPFINIFFDICEIERRKMEKTFTTKQYTVEEIDAIYKQTVAEMEKKTAAYLSDVRLGKNEYSFIQWNKYVREQTGYDNIKMFRLSTEK